MNFKGRIILISALREGISQRTGYPWRSCDIVMQGVDDPNQQAFISCFNDLCVEVMKISNEQMLPDGTIQGVYDATLASSVRKYTDKSGNTRYSEELSLRNISLTV